MTRRRSMSRIERLDYAGNKLIEARYLIADVVSAAVVEVPEEQALVEYAEGLKVMAGTLHARADALSARDRSSEE